MEEIRKRPVTRSELLIEGRPMLSISLSMQVLGTCGVGAGPTYCGDLAMCERPGIYA